MRDLRHAYLGVTHRRRGIAIDRTEIALAVDQHVTHRERLRHAHDGVIHRGIAMWVIFTDYVTDHARRFLVGLVVIVTQLVHRVQYTPVHRFEAVANVRQGAPDDNAHGVFEIRLAHLVF